MASHTHFLWHRMRLAAMGHEENASTLIWASGMALAVHQRTRSNVIPTLLAIDGNGSVSVLTGRHEYCNLILTAYGAFQRMTTHEPHIIAFKGYAWHALTATYVLGQGYRHYSAALMRFTTVDKWSPFAQGGLNTYAYCGDDPINFTDGSGAMRHPRPPTNGNSKLRPISRSRPRSVSSTQGARSKPTPRPETNAQPINENATARATPPLQPAAVGSSSPPREHVSNASALINAHWNSLSPEAKAGVHMMKYAKELGVSPGDAFDTIFPPDLYENRHLLKARIAREVASYRNLVELVRDPEVSSAPTSRPFGFWAPRAHPPSGH